MPPVLASKQLECCTEHRPSRTCTSTKCLYLRRLAITHWMAYEQREWSLKIRLHPQVTSEQTAKDEKNPSARLKWPHTGIVDMGEHRGKLTRQAAWDKPECSALTVHRCAKSQSERKMTVNVCQIRPARKTAYCIRQGALCTRDGPSNCHQQLRQEQR